jgi:hypothetical protein
MSYPLYIKKFPKTFVQACAHTLSYVPPSLVWTYYSLIILCSLSQLGGGEMGGVVVKNDRDKQE